jgi:replicative DNA helicase
MNTTLNRLNFENAAIGSMILEKAGQDIGFMFLKPEYFTNPLNLKVFEVMLKLKQERKAIDLITLSAYLKPYAELFKQEKQHYATYIVDLATCVNYADNITTYSQLVVEAYIERQIETLPKQLKDPKRILDAFEQLELIRERIKHIDKLFIDNGVVRGVEAYENACLKVLENTPAHLSWGLSNLTSRMTGIERGELIIVAGRPSMGKTDFALFILQQICLQKKHCLIFSIEMTADALFKRLMQFILRVDSGRLKTLNMNDYATALAIYKRDFEPYLNIVQSGTVTSAMVEAKASEFKDKYDKDFGGIIVDYLQIMAGDGNNETERVTKISNNLKRTAKDNLVPIIALSQLSREVEKRADKRPMLSDLRQTGAIEQDADAVLFLYREDYYLKEQDGYTKTFQLEVIAAKLREGETGTMHLHYNPATKVIADSEPINTPVKEIYTHNSSGEVFKTLDGKTTIDDFNSDKPTPF